MKDDSDSSAGGTAPVVSDGAAGDRAKKLVGTIISDRYRLHNLLAMGGMGAVFTGEHVHMRKRVAVKLLHPDMEGLPGLVARFEREAIVGAHIEHPNVASARDFGRLKDGSYYLVLEFVRGVTLRQLIHQGPITVRRAVRICKQIAAGLAAVHDRGIVHRDVAPRNVMVVPGPVDKVKLIDFGFAKVPVEKFAAMSVSQGTPIMPSEITSPGVIFGTIGYLAPEGVLGMKAVDARSDLYALGAILYEMLAGVPPFEAPTQAQLFLKHRTERVPRIWERAPDVEVPENVEAIARKLLAKSPSERYASAAEVEAALDEALAGLEPDMKSMPPLADEGLELTVLGAAPPVSLPRFEDVAEVTFDPGPEEDDAASDGKPPSSVPAAKPSGHGKSKSEPAVSGAPAADASGKSRWPLALAAVVLLGGAGVFAAHRAGLFGGAGSAAPTAANPTSTTSAPSPSLETANSAATVASGRSSAIASASAPASVSASASAALVDKVGGLDAEAWKRTVKQAPSTNNYDKAVDGILALAQMDPKALDPLDMRTIAVETTVRFAGDKERGAKLLDALSQSFGTAGPDILFEIVSKRGGSKAESAVAAVLAKPEVRAHGTKALQIAIDLREAKCNDKLALLERARTDGDERALAILVALRDPACDAASSGCCLRDNGNVESVVHDLSKRTEKPH